MENLDSQPKNYELAFHITPDLDEKEATQKAGEIESIVKKIGGNIKVFKEPTKTHLSYPLKHKHYAYFGFINFSASPESIEQLGKEIQLQTPIIRYMVLQKDLDDKRLAPTAKITTRKPPKIQEESAKAEDIEKELEEVL